MDGGFQDSPVTFMVAPEQPPAQNPPTSFSTALSPTILLPTQTGEGAPGPLGVRHSIDFGNDGTWEVGDGRTFAGSEEIAALTIPLETLVGNDGSMQVGVMTFDEKGVATRSVVAVEMFPTVFVSESPAVPPPVAEAVNVGRVEFVAGDLAGGGTGAGQDGALLDVAIVDALFRSTAEPPSPNDPGPPALPPGLEHPGEDLRKGGLERPLESLNRSQGDESVAVFQRILDVNHVDEEPAVPNAPAPAKRPSATPSGVPPKPIE